MDEILNPLIKEEVVYRVGNVKSPTAVIKLKENNKK